MRHCIRSGGPLLHLAAILLAILASPALRSAEAEPFAGHPINEWVKRSPLPDAPVSPRLGYEGACVWDREHRLLVRYGGHNQGGGGEQGAEVWTFDPVSGAWTLREPDISPPGVCCNQQNIHDPTTSRYIRFPLFSGNHGWQWHRELYLNDSSVWTYDLETNRWRDARPVPAPRLAGLRCASWDGAERVVVVFGGEGSREGTLVYDPWRNEWRWPRPSREPPPRSGGSMCYDAARRLHILFGSQFGDDPRTWAYSVSRNEWRDMRPARSPPTDRNDAVLTYDPLHRVVIALVKVTTGDGEDARHEVQTWAYDAGANEWTRLRPEREPDAAGNRTRNLVFAPELNLAILENCTQRPREQQVWTYRYAGSANAPAREDRGPTRAERRDPPVVEEVVVSVLSTRRIEVRWSPAAQEAPGASTVATYRVERAPVEVWSDDELARLRSRTAPLDRPSVGAIRRIGPFVAVTKGPTERLSLVDEGVDLSRPAKISGDAIQERRLHPEHLHPGGRPYPLAVFAYRVRAVDSEGRVSGPSPARFTVPSSPRRLFSREDGATCRLRWAPNPESGLRGYRVYRMDGRWNKDPVSRQTPMPLARTTWADPSAGEATRRYHVVAVDALGQEGFPSSPVWHRREWRAHYGPFTGEWHQ